MAATTTLPTCSLLPLPTFEIWSPVRLAAAQAAAIQPSSPRYFFSSLAGAGASSQRRIGIAVDLSDESAYAVRWAVQNYLRPGDAVLLLHVRPTSVLYGADWGSIPVSVAAAADDDSGGDEPASAEELQRKREEDFDAFTSTKSEDLAQPLVAAQIPFRIHAVKDHDMKERLCLEAERLGLSAMIMGSRGFGASRKGGKGRLGSVSDYCVHHCVCPVVVVRYPDDAALVAGEAPAAGATADELHTVPEDEPVYHDAPDAHKGVYEEWKDCAKQVNNFSGNLYQGYASREVTEEKWRKWTGHGRKKWRSFIVIITALLLGTLVGYVLYSLS